MPNRNVESRFSRVPILNHPRSKFKMPNSLNTTIKVGELTPIYVQEVMPGDTFKIDTNKFVREFTPLFPVMDNLYLDTFFFYVPNRLVWDHWEQFCGAQDKAWVNPNQEYNIPKLNIDVSEGIQVGSLLNLFGIPTIAGTETNIPDFSISALPIRAYGLIWNWYFRDQNTQEAIPVYTGDEPVNVSNDDIFGYDYFNDPDYGSWFNLSGSCCRVARFHDYFTSALPSPQKGPNVLIPASGYVSLIDPTKNTYVGNRAGFYQQDKITGILSSPVGASAMATTFGVAGETYSIYSSDVDTKVASNVGLQSNTSLRPMIYNPAGTLGFDNLKITINDLRLAATMQQWEEISARAGSRYNEYLYAHYGVTSPDSRLQIPEYLGGDRIALNMSDIEQTSSTSGNSPLGQLAGKSQTFRQEHSVFKSFVEHGFIIGVCCIRPDTTYAQGIDAMWFRDNIFDYYDPVFANIGEMPIYKRELRLGSDQDEVFGYKEAWSEYRYKPNKMTGGFSMLLSGNCPLAGWSYTPNVANFGLVDLIPQTALEVDRTLAISNPDYQFIAQFYFDVEATRPMPLYSIPGLKRL